MKNFSVTKLLFFYKSTLTGLAFVASLTSSSATTSTTSASAIDASAAAIILQSYLDLHKVTE